MLGHAGIWVHGSIDQISLGTAMALTQCCNSSNFDLLQLSMGCGSFQAVLNKMGCLFEVQINSCRSIMCGACVMQRLVKRSTEVLQKPEYQLLYCKDGLATGEELQRLKIVGASEHYGF